MTFGNPQDSGRPDSQPNSLKNNWQDNLQGSRLRYRHIRLRPEVMKTDLSWRKRMKALPREQLSREPDRRGQPVPVMQRLMRS